MTIVEEAVVYIVDDDPAVRDALTLMLEQENLKVQSFENAPAFLQVCQPDFKGCLIIDVRMPEMDGLQLQALLHHRNIKLPIIFLTGHGNIPMSVKAIKAGAVDFLTKPVVREKLLASIRSAFREDEQRINKALQNKVAVSCLGKLTQREREVMMLAVQGYSNKKIAHRLGISYRTVEIHKSRIKQKTGSTNLIDLARIASEAGLTNKCKKPGE